MNIIGLNAYHPDAAVALFRNGKLVWAAEEERYARIKHVSGFFAMELRECLKEKAVSAADIDWGVIRINP